jgi:chromosomal replication initiator protein
MRLAMPRSTETAAESLPFITDKSLPLPNVGLPGPSLVTSTPVTALRQATPQPSADLPVAVAGTENAAEIWTRVKRRLRAEVGEEIYASWFQSLEFDRMNDGVVRLSVATRFLRNWVDSHYGGRLLGLWSGELQGVTRVEIEFRNGAVKAAVVRPVARAAGAVPGASSAETLASSGAPPVRPPRPPVAPAPSARGEGRGESGSPLDARYSFASFVAGRGNSLAMAAAKQVADARRGDAVMFNPLYVHGGVGLGKTHLLQATAAAIQASGNRRVMYLTAERFMFDFASALKSQTTIAFKEALQHVDVIVVDDLQFLTGKTMQAEFCHILNTALDSGRQVVVAADRPPHELEALEDRVRSRLGAGLAVEIGALDEDLRLSILKNRIALARQQHPGFDVPAPVLAYVARNISQNGRDLDGAFNRLLAFNKLNGQAITLEMAETALRDLIRSPDLKRVKIEDIQRIVAKHYNVTRADMLSARRTANVVKPRQVAMYLAKQLTLRSLPEIGRRFGGRDHTTVLHAVRKIDTLLPSDTLLAGEVELLKRLLAE